jgi:hypothetical protein
MMDEITKEIQIDPNNNIQIGNEALPGCLLWMDDVILIHNDLSQLENNAPLH